MERAEWLEQRRKGIGGSDIAAVLGVSKFATPFDVWVGKIHGRAEFSTPDTRRGNHLEPGIASWYGEEAECVMSKAESISHPHMSFARCTPDFLASKAGEHWVVSIKAPRRSEGWGEPGSESVPLGYYLQIQWEMMVLSALGHPAAAKGEIVALLYGELARYPIAPNPDVQLGALAKAREFWERYVATQTPPPLDSGESVGPWLSRRYASAPAREFVPSTPEIDLLALEWQQAEQKIKGLEERIDGIKNKVRDAIGSEDAAGIEGPFGRIGWRSDKNGKRSLRPRWK
jgi:putative phage-type endonuclease